MQKGAKTVFVGLSGGVDSSVSAALLKDQGYNVVGVFIRTWQPDFIECTWRDERRDAMRVAAHLNIPFLECDGEAAYRDHVAKYMIDEYKRGRTPNPDVMCNREVKFGVFWQFAKAHGADFIATGHYTQVYSAQSIVYSKSQKNLKTIDYRLKTSADKAKEQSYFLWMLTQDDLKHVLFPVGHLQKSQVRKLAEKYKLPTATKKDSQGVCFLGPLDMKDFLKHYIKEKKGNVLDTKGEIIGHHPGALFFTLRERHGFTITKKGANDERYYVIAKDIKKNTITVSYSPKQDLNDTKDHSGILQNIGISIPLEKTNWISEIPNENKKYTAQIRYHGEFLPCAISQNKKTWQVNFKEPTLVSPGQSIVVYDRDICLGGGVVS